MIFTAEYRITDGRVFCTRVEAVSWEDALQRASDSNLTILGLLCMEVDAETDARVDYPGVDDFPPCPPHLRNHPNLKRWE